MCSLFYSLLRFIIALFFILIGLIGLMIPWSIHVRTLLAQFIFEDSLAISLFGFAFFVIGTTLTIHILLNAKRRYYHINSKKACTKIDEVIIQEYLNIYWKQLFPKNDVPCQLTLKGNKIHITVDLPYLPKQEQKSLLERIRKDFIDMFAKIFGYNDEFYLSASFQNQSKEI